MQALRSPAFLIRSAGILVVCAAVAPTVVRAQAQSVSVVAGPPGYEIACSIQGPAGSRACDDRPSPRSCEEEANDASRPSNESTGIALTNRSDQPVKVYWLNFQGRRVIYDKYLAPGSQLSQQTFIGHNWLVTTLSDQCIGIFKTASLPPANLPVATLPAADLPPAEPQPSDAGSVGEQSVVAAPPPIPEYDQPPPPQDDLVWTPGYWAWSDDSGDYYWVPGTWVAAPIVGYLWTPGYWLAQREVFFWHAGYWGPHVGFYGGINYGYGYFGRGYAGGAWRNGRMLYNSAVTNVGNLQSGSTYSEPVARPGIISHISYNGTGGVSARPSPAETAAMNEYHIPPTGAQLQQLHAAHSNPDLRAGFNNGHPPIGATSRPGEAATAPPPQHRGTLSFTHSTTPPAPAARATGVSAPSSPAAMRPAAQSVRAQTQTHAQIQTRPAQQQSQIVQSPDQSAAASDQRAAAPDNQQSRQSGPRPRPVPHSAAHPPS